jgi:prepilin-type N-terminal cleavage/methylation domain-containing protein
MYCLNDSEPFAVHHRSGFALIEVIVAVLILSVSFPIFYGILSQGAATVIRMRDGMISQAVVESELNRVLNDPSSPKVCFSRYENCEVATVEAPEGLVLPSDFDFQRFSVNTAPAENGLHKVSVSIEWKTKGRLLNFGLYGFLRVDEELL